MADITIGDQTFVVSKTVAPELQPLLDELASYRAASAPPPPGAPTPEPTNPVELATMMAALLKDEGYFFAEDEDGIVRLYHRRRPGRCAAGTWLRSHALAELPSRPR